MEKKKKSVREGRKELGSRHPVIFRRPFFEKGERGESRRNAWGGLAGENRGEGH